MLILATNDNISQITVRCSTLGNVARQPHLSQSSPIRINRILERIEDNFTDRMAAGRRDVCSKRVETCQGNGSNENQPFNHVNEMARRSLRRHYDGYRIGRMNRGQQHSRPRVRTICVLLWQLPGSNCRPLPGLVIRKRREPNSSNCLAIHALVIQA